MGYKPKDAENVHDIMADAKSRQGAGSQAPGTPQMKGPGAGDAGPKADMMKKSGGSRPSTLVVTLVEKLDALTTTPGKLQLDADQRTKILAALAELAKPDFLGDVPAQEQMNVMLGALKNNRQTLEEAGFKWPEGGDTPPTRPSENPFKSGEASAHLQALQDRLSKAS
jgi:hypothetical protein